MNQAVSLHLSGPFPRATKSREGTRVSLPGAQTTPSPRQMEKTSSKEGYHEASSGLGGREETENMLENLGDAYYNLWSPEDV